MKRIIWIFIAALFVYAAPSYGQKKSKEEIAQEKEWAKKLKELTPQDYKKLVEEKDALSNRVLELESANVSLKSDNEKKEAEVAKLRKELEDYNSGHAPAAQSLPIASTTRAAGNDLSTKRGPSQGIIYKIQIGSFRNKDLSKYFDNNPNFSGEVDSDGTKKYTLGMFSDYWEADRFKKALREMGVKDAWIVPYKDGQRVNIKDVLEGTL